MSKIKSLDELFIEEVNDLYSAEMQLVDALPKLADATVSDHLRNVLENHLVQTKDHVNRLDEVFIKLGQKPRAVVCKAMKGIVAEGQEVINKTEKCATRDAAIIGAAQRAEHYEIAGYGTAQSHAGLLGKDDIRELLGETLYEEKEADGYLNELAENVINFKAKQAL
ncbi:MAG: ferritin-like domain-containing protein [Candidatus Omnitrophica bacterium]|nr:ferritin-like domain-containing protein [Candidatus Omnitrophota bacterium]